jgi:general nucleoside transport system permease protein
MINPAIEAFAAASVRTATPLAFAALGELVTERSGVINIGLEGVIIAGAFGSMLGASIGGVDAGFAGAAISGVLVALVFALFVVTIGADQIITGTAISMLGLGLTGTLYSAIYGSAGIALRIPTVSSMPVPLLRQIPLVGPAFFAQPMATYVLYLLVPVLSWWMYRSSAGLSLRAVGERPEAAAAAGISPARVRWWAIVFGGAMGGLSGGVLVLAQAGTFAEGMSAGRGYLAVAIVVLGRWRPYGVAVAALFFGAASALKFLAQAMGWDLPYELSLAFPYVLTLAALALVRGRAVSPAALGHPLTLPR